MLWGGLARALATYTNSKHTDWDLYLQFISFSINLGIQKSINDSPFFTLFHQDPKIPLDNLMAHEISIYNETPSVNDLVAMNFQWAWENARLNLAHAQSLQKARCDEKFVPSTICVGDLVLIRDHQTGKGLSQKLTAKY